MTLDEFQILNSSSYDLGTSAQLYEDDFAVLTKRIQKLDQHEGPRIGDFVRMADNSLLRLASQYPDEPKAMQPSVTPSCTVYINRSGICEYSGTLGDSLPLDTLQQTPQTQPGHVWFFSTDQPKTRLYASVSFRVYQYTSRT